MDEDPLYHAEREMARYELEAMSALFGKLAARVGLDVTHPVSEERMQSELSTLIEQDADAAELARTVLALKGLPRPIEPKPGRPVGLGAAEDLADADAVYSVIEACRSIATRGRARSGPGRMLKEAIWTIWEQPRLPGTLLDGRCPTLFPWSPSARGTIATQARRPQGLVVGHLYPLSLLAADLLDESNGSAGITQALLRERIMAVVVTRQEERLVSRPTGIPWEAFAADPWCQYRVVLPVAEFAPVERDR